MFDFLSLTGIFPLLKCSPASQCPKRPLTHALQGIRPPPRNGKRDRIKTPSCPGAAQRTPCARAQSDDAILHTSFILVVFTPNVKINSHLSYHLTKTAGRDTNALPRPVGVIHEIYGLTRRKAARRNAQSPSHPCYKSPRRSPRHTPASAPRRRPSRGSPGTARAAGGSFPPWRERSWS